MTPRGETQFFYPMVFSATGGMGHEAMMFYKRQARLLSDAWKEPYAAVLGIEYLIVFYILQFNA